MHHLAPGLVFVGTFAVANEQNSIPPYGDPCPQQDVTTSLFTGLHRGILAVGFDPSRTFSVDHATFTSTHQGIRMEGVQDASITRSSFAVPSPMVQGVVLGPTNGIYSDQCTGYRIQENSFHTTQPGAPYKVGLIIKDSGPAPNTFYNNTFDNLHTGSIIQGNNATAIDLIGLEVKCKPPTAATFSWVVPCACGQRREVVDGW